MIMKDTDRNIPIEFLGQNAKGQGNTDMFNLNKFVTQ